MLADRGNVVKRRFFMEEITVFLYYNVNDTVKTKNDMQEREKLLSDVLL